MSGDLETIKDVQWPRVPIFVYGTLRPEMGLWSAISKSVLFHTPAIARGTLHHLPKNTRRQDQAGTIRFFPLADFNTPGTIHGDLLWMPVCEALASTILMESRAGYVMREIIVRVHNEASVSHKNGFVGAYGFHYPFTLGPKIESGDWKLEVDPPEQVFVGQPAE